jgi:hypothetical protein
MNPCIPSSGQTWSHPKAGIVENIHLVTFTGKSSQLYPREIGGGVQNWPHTPVNFPKWSYVILLRRHWFSPKIIKGTRFIIFLSRDVPLFSFPVATIINCHKHSSLKQNTFFLLEIQNDSYEIKISLPTGLCSFQKLFLCLFQILSVSCIPQLMLQSSSHQPSSSCFFFW